MTTAIVATAAQQAQPGVALHLMSLTDEAPRIAQRQRPVHPAERHAAQRNTDAPVLSAPTDPIVNDLDDRLAAAMCALASQLEAAAATDDAWVQRLDMCGGVLADAGELAQLVRTAPNELMRGLCMGLLMARMTSADHRKTQSA